MRRSIFLLFCLLSGGCATFSGRPPGAGATQTVVAEGTAPIVNGDIAGARKASLDDAMKNALGLVIGVHVSQESFVSKVLLLEDVIRTQTKGYIERYRVLRESQEGGFYRTGIKAEIRRDDLRAALAPEVQGNGLRGITVNIGVEETFDGSSFSLRAAQNALKIKFASAGFVVMESSDTDIVISGKAAANLVSSAAVYGYLSCRAVLSLTAKRSGSAEELAVVQVTDGGADTTREAAANAALVNAANRAAPELVGSIRKLFQDHSAIRLTIINVNTVDSLNNILRLVRSLSEVKDCRVRAFTGYDAQVDLDARQGAAFDIARHLERISSGKILIKHAKEDTIQAICIFNYDY